MLRARVGEGDVARTKTLPIKPYWVRWSLILFHCYIDVFVFFGGGINLLGTTTTSVNLKNSLLNPTAAKYLTRRPNMAVMSRLVAGE